MKFLHLSSFAIVVSVLLILNHSVMAQEAIESNENKQKVSYVKHQRQVNGYLSNAGESVSVIQTSAKEADFQLYSFPSKGKTYLSVASAIPNKVVKVLVYDVSGKIIYNNDELTNSNGEFVLQISPRYDYIHGECFIAAIYNGQAFYETLPLVK